MRSRLLVATGVAFAIAGTALPQGYPLWETLGSGPDWSFGASISSTGDLDGDGLGDLLVASAQFGPGSP
ncbi:MAG: hypothetical protein ACREIU_15250, partial [Planctomycetota bacterium]